MRINCLAFVSIMVLWACNNQESSMHGADGATSSHIVPAIGPLVPGAQITPLTEIKTGGVTPAQLLSFAQSLNGIPYKYGSTDPAQGFDCSGFITYVFNHFGVIVPRSSADFNFVNRAISVKDAKPGDLILFTGTDSTVRRVGHMGIVLYINGKDLVFIHSTSGKQNGVTETPLNVYYQGRYMKILRIFPQNDR